MFDFVANCLEIIPARLADYERLSEYHYRTEPIKPTTQIYKVRLKPPHTNSMPDPIAVIVYRMPIPEIRPRTTATKGYFHQPKTLSARLKLVNQKIQYIARLIVDPRFRKMGIATWLLKDTLERQQVPIIETLTPIDFTNKIFQKAGFKLFLTPAPPWYRRFTNELLSIGLTEDALLSPLHVQARLDRLKPPMAEPIEHEIKIFIRHFRHRDHMAPDINRTKFFLSKIRYPEAYLIWFNPRVPL